jgi:hypothetical protein
VDPSRDVAQLDERLLGLAVGRVDELQGTVGVQGHRGARIQLLLGLSEPHRERRQLRLRPIVQVAFDPSQRDRRVVDCLRSTLFQTADAFV